MYICVFYGNVLQDCRLEKMSKQGIRKPLTADCLCHGVPSPKVWNSYIKEITGDINDIKIFHSETKVQDGKNTALQ